MTRQNEIKLNRKNLFKDKEFFTGVVKIGIPIALQQLLYAVFSVVDTSMIAQLGADSTAGVGAAVRVFFFMLVINVGLIAATSSLVAQYWGIKDFYNIRRTTGLSLTVGIVIGVIFSAITIGFPEQIIAIFTEDAAMIREGASYLSVLGYGFVFWCFNFIFATALKSTECVRIPLVASIITILTNIFLNWVFIFGNLGAPQMGAAGAALGTVISYVIQTVILVVAVIVKKHGLAHKIRDYFSWSKAFVKKFFKIMTPAFVNEIFWGGGTLMYAFVLGRYGNVNFGSYTLFTSVESMFFTFFIGLGGACSVLIGKELGKGETEKGWRHSVRSLVLAIGLAVILGVVAIVVRYPVLSLMHIPDINMVHMTAKLIMLFALVLPLRVVSYMTVVGIFRAGGDTISGLWIDSTNVWLVGVPVTLIAGFVIKAPFEWVFMAMYSEDIFKTILCLVIFSRKRWMNQLTHDSEVFTKGATQID